MSRQFVGRLVSDRTDSGGQRVPLSGFKAELRLVDALLPRSVGSAVSGPSGDFTIVYPAFTPAAGGERWRLELTVKDAVGRVVPLDTSGTRRIFEDRDQGFDEGDIVVPDAEATGWLVTLGTGQTPSTQSGATQASGWGLSHGNAVHLLIDNEAFEHIADRLPTAQQSIVISQLFFAIPSEHHADPLDETPKLIFRFAVPPPDGEQFWAVGFDDARPERLLLDAANRNVPVRILAHSFEVPLWFKILAGIVVFPFGGSDTVAHVVGEVLDDDLSDADELQHYFDDSGAPLIRVRDFQQSPLSAGVMHAKLGVIDDLHAWCIGAPFGQSYVDTHGHEIEAPRRGSGGGFPQHDIGFAVSGPAAGDLRATLKLLWNNHTLDPSDRVADDTDEPANPPVATAGGDAVCSVQIVRTLSENRFSDPAKGEKGILEGYLRAIALAEKFIYFETQYFTDDPVGDALAAAMKRNPDLQVILLVNIRPDVPFYPFKQRRLITRIRKHIGETANGARQFGVYTRWSHDLPRPGAPLSQSRPRLLPIYVHAKVGLIDDAWASIGSANLDGLSLDSALISDVLNWAPGLFGAQLFDEQRAIEVNGNFLNALPGQPRSAIVDLLRRRLWAEHLGFWDAQGQPVPTAPELAGPPGPEGWLKLWRERAAATLDHLINTPLQPLDGKARVLPWPEKDSTFSSPREHLTALGIASHKVVPLKSTRKFTFRKSMDPFNGDWDPKGPAKMDY